MEKGNDGYKKGLWTEEEDKILMDYVNIHGKGHWNSISKKTGLKRCGKSCRLRWMNYLNPGIKRGHFSEEEQDLIIRLHRLLGNRWSLIAGRVPGRTDNQVKNYWNTHLSKKLGINKGPRKIAGGVTSTNSDGNSPKSDSEANKNIASSSDLDHTTSVHSDSHPQQQSLSSCAFPILPFTDSSHQAPLDMDVPQPQHPTTTVLSSDGYATNSSFWVSEFDGLMGDCGTNPACFMELICGTSFNLDWNHL